MDSLPWVTCVLVLNILICSSFLWCTPLSLKQPSVVLVGLQLEMFVMIRFCWTIVGLEDCRRAAVSTGNTAEKKQQQQPPHANSGRKSDVWEVHYSLRKHKHWNVCICCLHVHITNSVSVYSFELPACVWDAAVQQTILTAVGQTCTGAL